MRNLLMLAALAAALVFPRAAAADAWNAALARYETATVTATTACGSTAAQFFVIGAGTVVVDVRGTFVQTLRVQTSANSGTSWSADQTLYPDVAGAGVVSITAPGVWFLPVLSKQWVCVYGQAFTSGSATVAVNSSPGVYFEYAQGLAPAGAAITGNPVLTGGSDGTLTRTFLTDTSGREIVVGAAAAGAAVAGNPVLVGGTDGASVRTISIDSLGNAGVRPLAGDGSPTVGSVGSAIPGGATIIGATDGTNAVRLAVGSAANQSAAVTGNKALLTIKPGSWSVTHNPAAATQATASKAAIASTRHVVDCVTVGLTPIAAQAAGVVYNLRDGATGAGTVLWSVQLIGQAGVAQPPVTFCGLNIPGTANTAMTLESAAAPAATNFAFVTLTGYDAN